MIASVSNALAQVVDVESKAVVAVMSSKTGPDVDLIRTEISIL